MKRIITADALAGYAGYLKDLERAPGTIENYLRHIRAFAAFADRSGIEKETVTRWKEFLREKGYSVASINAMLVSLNGFFSYMNWKDCRTRLLRHQQRMFRDQRRELTKEEYLRLVETARSQDRPRLALILETICGTGIRVSELKYITVEALVRGRAEIALKGKIRTILIPGKLSRKLLKYARHCRIKHGEVFRTKNGRSISRRQIWAEMKSLCEAAHVAPSKVFPHNLRHLFAQTFYRVCRDIVKLADVLGHSSVETTRIYLLSTGQEHMRQLNRLGLVC